MINWLSVAAGSALGGVLRYGAARAWPGSVAGLPFATLTVNVVGSFTIGALYVALVQKAAAPEAARLFWMTGVLGGFTTYSAFALETSLLATSADAARAALYVGVTVIGCLAAAFAGRAIANVVL